jgi:hypothetical protein
VAAGDVVHPATVTPDVFSQVEATIQRLGTARSERRIVEKLLLTIGAFGV